MRLRVFLAFLFASPLALGGQPSREAEALFQSGKDAMERGDLATACAKLAESQRLEPAPGTLLNLASCEERSSRLTLALAHFKDARARLADGDFRVAFAEQHAADLARRIPRLTLALTGTPDPGVIVLRDGTEVPPGSLGVAAQVDPGPHVCVVRAPGRADARLNVTLREGDDRTIELTQGPRLAEPAPFAPTRASPQKVAGLALAGAGLASLTLGAIFGLVSKSTYDDARTHCPSGPASCDDLGVHGGQTARAQATVATIAFIAGGALVAGGAVLYFTAPKIAVAPTVGGLRIGGAW